MSMFFDDSFGGGFGFNLLGTGDLGFGGYGTPDDPGYGYNWGLPTFGGLTLPTGGSAAAPSSTKPAWQILIEQGLAGLKTWLNFDLASQQVAAGQYPALTPGGTLTTAAGSLSSFLPLLIVIVVLVVIFKAVSR